MAVGPDGDGLRLDIFCAHHVDALSRSQIQRLNREGHILVDGRPRPDHYALRDGEVVEISVPPPPRATGPAPQPLPLRVAFEDDHILVINKEAGMVAHPAHGNRDGTLVNAVLGRGTPLSNLGGEARPGIVHRLDKDTSGLIVLAKTDEAFGGLTRSIKNREFAKVYHAIVWGNLGRGHLRIDAPIARHPVNRQKMAVPRRGGRGAMTDVFVVDTFESFDYIRVVTLTGRTHQIRVHLSHISHPILGDSVYGGRRKKGLSSSTRVRDGMNRLLKLMTRQALHASRLSFEHPVTGEPLDFRTALPEDMRLSLEVLHSKLAQGG